MLSKLKLLRKYYVVLSECRALLVELQDTGVIIPGCKQPVSFWRILPVLPSLPGICSLSSRGENAAGLRMAML